MTKFDGRFEKFEKWPWQFGPDLMLYTEKYSSMFDTNILMIYDGRART